MYLLTRLRRDTRGAATVEFAFLALLLLLLWAGGTEIARLLNTSHRVEVLAKTIVDLTAQGDRQNPMSAVLMNDILATSQKILSDGSTTGVQVVVSAVGASGTTRASVCSSVSSGGAAARPVGVASDIALPRAFAKDGSRFLYAEVRARYVPLFGDGLFRLASADGEGFILSEQLAWPTRGGTASGAGTEIVLPDGRPCP